MLSLSHGAAIKLQRRRAAWNKRGRKKERKLFKIFVRHNLELKLCGYKKQWGVNAIF